MKKIILTQILFFLMAIGYAQTQHPSEFLGYPIGSRFTAHHRIVDYFDYLAKENEGRVKIVPYGETYEHRPLFLSIFSSAENMNRLDQIRKNNLRLAGMSKDKMAAQEDMPAIVWLSYNVHGNEPSSSEAALLTAYALVDPKNTDAQTWLENTIVIIDPCLNPDGRERYTHWFASTMGRQPNLSTDSREHREPWPGGRSNHYYFDLNRDWAWQSQKETEARMQQYNQWIPQVHVDFHEQGINNPYYFAPAAQPFHEVITTWQRNFQTTIGKNNAAVFDKNNWLYFTKEYFDLLYPSYGDTYPLFNGAIGMTYEQAGGPGGGLSVIGSENDTLTLTDRALHHFVTGMATIQTASENRLELIRNFKQYFSDALQAKYGEYKTYIVKNNPGDRERINALRVLLEKNGIQYGSGSGKGRGYDYARKIESNFEIRNGDIVISSAQPKSALLQVLFEPDTKLVDSVTYDITAWALPYAYGLEAYASKSKIEPTAFPATEFTENIPTDSYGYIFKLEGLESAKAIAGLLQKNIRLRFSELPIAIQGNRFEAGSVIILKNGNQSQKELWDTVATICNRLKIPLFPFHSGMVESGPDMGSDRIHSISKPNVALLLNNSTNPGSAGEIWNFFDNQLAYPLHILDAHSFGRIQLHKYDVLILPDGGFSFLEQKNDAAKLKQWIEQGGKLIALESGATAISNQDWSNLKLKNASENKAEDEEPYAALQPYNHRERNYQSSNIPGAIFKASVDNTHPLMFGYPDFYYTLKTSGNVFSFLENKGWNVAVFKDDSKMSGFVGHKLQSVLKDGLLFGVQELGRGKVIYLTDNLIFRDFWYNGKGILSNAIFLVQ